MRRQPALPSQNAFERRWLRASCLLERVVAAGIVSQSAAERFHVIRVDQEDNLRATEVLCSALWLLAPSRLVRLRSIGSLPISPEGHRHSRLHSEGLVFLQPSAGLK